MGIKGAFSLLCNEPTRFGSAWTSSTTDSNVGPPSNVETITNETVYYIDGPGLHYHLLQSPISSFVQDVTTATGTENKYHYSHNGIMSPENLYGQTHAFLSLLLQACFTTSSISNHYESIHQKQEEARKQLQVVRIYLVMDGVASEAKRAQQLDRLLDSSRKAEECARRFIKGNNCKGNKFIGSRCGGMAHLLGEDAMAEALHNVINEWKKASESSSHGDRVAYNDMDVHMDVLWSEGEAETFIANHAAANRRISCYGTTDSDVALGNGEKGRRTVVFSNDSDFLVFDSLTGFVPFHTLQFHKSYGSHVCSRSDCNATNASAISGSSINKFDSHYNITLTGWEYTNYQFISAFPFLVLNHHQQRQQLPQKSNKNIQIGAANVVSSVMTTIAALSGCDYKLSSSSILDTARRIIVQSDIGGLRKKDRNNPTARGTFLAIIRYVSHIIKRDDNYANGITYWRERLGWCIIKAGKNMSKQKQCHERYCCNWVRDFVSILEQVEQIYAGQYHHRYPEQCEQFKFRNDSGYDFDAQSHSNTDVRRLMKQKVFYCRPLVETWDNYSGKCSNILQTNTRLGEKSGSNHKKHKKGIHKKCKKTCKRSKRREIEIDKGISIIKCRDRGDVDDDSDHCGDYCEKSPSKSIWMNKNFVDCRRRLYGVLLSNLTLNKIITVSEYCRAGIGPQMTFQEFTVDVSEYIASFQKLLRSESLASVCTSIMHYIILGQTEEDIITKRFQLLFKPSPKNELSSDLLLRNMKQLPLDNENSAPSHNSISDRNISSYFVLLPTLLLTQQEDVILLILTTYISPLYTVSRTYETDDRFRENHINSNINIKNKRSGYDMTSDASVSTQHQEFLCCSCRVELALYHIKLVLDGVQLSHKTTQEKNISTASDKQESWFISSVDGDNARKVWEHFQVHRSLSYHIMIIIWNSIVACFEDIGNEKIEDNQLKKEEKGVCNKIDLSFLDCVLVKIAREIPMLVTDNNTTLQNNSRSTLPIGEIKNIWNRWATYRNNL